MCKLYYSKLIETLHGESWIIYKKREWLWDKKVFKFPLQYANPAIDYVEKVKPKLKQLNRIYR